MARRLGPCQIREGSLLPIRDGLADRVFHDQAKHIPAEEPKEEVQAKGQVIAESVDSWSEGTEAKNLGDKMVIRRR